MARDQRQNESLAVRLPLVCASAIVAETCTYPLDTLKTRLQLQGEAAGRAGAHQARLGIVQLGVAMARTEGLASLYRGLCAAALRHILYTGAAIVGL